MHEGDGIVRASIDYPVLRRPRLAAGVGFRTATSIWSVTALVVMTVGLPWGLGVVPFGAVIHGVLAWLFRKDDRIFEIYLTYEALATRCRAGLPSEGEQSAVSRPKGYARGLPL
jgi:type IV secretory pathway VirB3-like protein